MQIPLFDFNKKDNQFYFCVPFSDRNSKRTNSIIGTNDFSAGGVDLKTTIYLDILLAVNLFVNYFLLLATNRFLHSATRRIRLVLSAGIGALYSLIILLPVLPPVVSVPLQFAVAALMVFSAFGKMRVIRFFKAFACFYLMNFVFAGGMFAIWYFLAPSGMVMKNSVVYFNISPLWLCLATVVIYLVFYLISRITGQMETQNLYYRLLIRTQGRECSCEGKIDTGNHLTEPFSGFPVIVIEYAVVQSLFPDLPKQKEMDTQWALENHFRMVPFHALGKDGLLPAFSPEFLSLHNKKEQIQVRDVYLAICFEKLEQGSFQALISPQAISRGKFEKRGKKNV